MNQEKLLRRIISAILDIPVVVTFAGRGTLLNGIPPISLKRDEGNAALDIDLLVTQLINFQTVDGQNCLILLLENAIWHVRGTTLAQKLEEFQQEVKEELITLISFIFLQRTGFVLQKCVQNRIFYRL